MTTQLNNKPPSGNTMRNANGCELHFRIEWDDALEAKFVLFYFPGYSAHINRPEIFRLSKSMNQNNTVFIAMDLQGHGHSEGKRCQMLNHEHMIADVLQLVESFMDESQFKKLKLNTESPSFKMENLQMLRKLPFFIMGSSMGAAVSLVCAQILYSAENRLKYPNFQGAIFVAPALRFKTPSVVVTETLRFEPFLFALLCIVKKIWTTHFDTALICLFHAFYRLTMGNCAPGAIMPTWMTPVADLSLTFRDPETLAYTKLDAWGNPGGLGWGRGMRYGTALMFVKFSPVIQRTMSEVKFPFLIVHDPEDKVCAFEGSTALMEKSITSAEHKKLIEVIVLIILFSLFRITFLFHKTYFLAADFPGSRLSARCTDERA